MPIHRSVTRRPHCVQRIQKAPPCDDRNPMAGRLWAKPRNRDENHYKTVQHVQRRTACVDMRVQWRTFFHGVSCWRSRSDVERPYCRPLDKSLIWECLTKPCWDIRRNSLRRSTTGRHRGAAITRVEPRSERCRFTLPRLCRTATL